MYCCAFFRNMRKKMLIVSAQNLKLVLGGTTFSRQFKNELPPEACFEYDNCGVCVRFNDRVDDSACIVLSLNCLGNILASSDMGCFSGLDKVVGCGKLCNCTAYIKHLVLDS